MASVAAASPEEEPEKTPAKNKGGRPANKLKTDLEELKRLALGGSGRKHLKKITGVSEDDAKSILRITGMTVEEFKEDQRKKLQEVSDMALTRVRETINEAGPLAAATCYGIFNDKLAKANPGPTNNLHLHLKETDRDALLAVLLGRQKERTVSVPSQHDQSTKDGKMAGPSSPVIDLEPTESPDADSLSADN
jgi:hypothetical protein